MGEIIELYTIIQRYIATVRGLIALILLGGMICIAQQLAASAGEQKSVDVLTLSLR